MAVLRLFAGAREAAGTNRDVVDAATVGELLRLASERYGERFSELLPTCRIWLNGDEAQPDAVLNSTDEVAVLPPVSGGLG